MIIIIIDNNNIVDVVITIFALSIKMLVNAEVISPINQ